MIIKHNIYASKWNKHDNRLITWYIKEYWSELGCLEHIPQFLIFFNIRYRPANDFGWLRIFRWHLYVKRRIIKELHNIFHCVNESCPCGMIEELMPVSIEDVKDWFSYYNIYDNELLRQQKIASIFTEKNKPVKMKSMAEIEIALEQIIREYEKEIIGW